VKKAKLVEVRVVLGRDAVHAFPHVTEILIVELLALDPVTDVKSYRCGNQLECVYEDGGIIARVLVGNRVGDGLSVKASVNFCAEKPILSQEVSFNM